MVLPFEEILNVRDQCWVLVEVSFINQKVCAFLFILFIMEIFSTEICSYESRINPVPLSLIFPFIHIIRANKTKRSIGILTINA